MKRRGKLNDEREKIELIHTCSALYESPFSESNGGSSRAYTPDGRRENLSLRKQYSPKKNTKQKNKRDLLQFPRLLCTTRGKKLSRAIALRPLLKPTNPFFWGGKMGSVVQKRKMPSTPALTVVRERPV